MKNNYKDFWSGLIYLSVGMAAVLISREYPLGTAVKMGPGYFPTVLGGILSLIGAIALVRSFTSERSPIGGFATLKVAFVVASVALFGFVAKEGGLVPATMLLVVLSAAASRFFSWKTSVALALGMAVFSVLVFVKGLGLPIQSFGVWFGQ